MRRELVIYMDTTEETEASVRMSANVGFVLLTYEGVKFEIPFKELKLALNDLEDFQEGIGIDRSDETCHTKPVFGFDEHAVEFKTEEEFNKENK